MQLVDSFRPGHIWGNTRHKTPRSSAVDAIAELAAELDIDPDPAYRMTSKPPPADSMNILTAIIGEAREDVARSTPAKGPMTVGAMRDQLRAVGIDLGHQRSDAEDRKHYAAHEVGHAVAALALGGWKVAFIDAAAGQCKVIAPDYSEWRPERDKERAVIAAAGSVFAGTASSRAENESDRVAVRLLGNTRWEEARAEAELMAKDRRVKALHKTLTDALLASPNGRLEGASLRAVLADWEGD